MTRRWQWTLCVGSFLLAALGAPRAFSLVVREWNGPYAERWSAAAETSVTTSGATARRGAEASLLFAGDVAVAPATRGG